MLIRESELGNERFQNGTIVTWAVAIAPYPLNMEALWDNETPANCRVRVVVETVPTRFIDPFKVKFRGSPFVAVNDCGLSMVSCAESRSCGSNELLYCVGAIVWARSSFLKMIP